MTLIIDMASGARCDEPLFSHAAEHGARDQRQELPAAKVAPGLQTITPTAATPGMPAMLRTCDLEPFLDHMA